MYMQLDVNIDIYPMHVGEKFAMSLASTLDLDGTPDTGYYTQVILFFSLDLQCHIIWAEHDEFKHKLLVEH